MSSNPDINTIIPSPLILPGRSDSGCGCLASLPAAAIEAGPRGVLVHGRSLRASGRLDSLCAETAEIRIHCREHTGGEPTLDDLRELLAFIRRHQPDWIAAVGGGSVIDLAKAGAGLAAATGDVRIYHDGAPIPASGMPFLAAPTTAGTGSECTPVCVLTNEDTGVKKSIRHEKFMARRVFLDGETVVDCPRSTIAMSGMDALTQAIEAYTSRFSSRFTDELALQALRLIAGRLEAVYTRATPESAQELLTGSYLAGMALTHARLGIVHGLAHPLGARFHAAHGLVCAFCLPAALEFNRETLGAKWELMSEAVGGDIRQTVCRLLDALELSSPFRGRRLDDRQAAVRETMASGSTAANPRPVTAKDVEWFLENLTAAD